jgi:hypothetical protein
MSSRAHRRFLSPSAFLSFVSLLTLAAVLLGVSWLAEAKRGRKKAPAASTADCKTDADCVLVPDDCCPCSEGGKQRAIPKKEKVGYEKERRKRCTGTMCTEMVSQDPSCSQRAFCGAGICELGEPAADSTP